MVERMHNVIMLASGIVNVELYYEFISAPASPALQQLLLRVAPWLLAGA